MDGVTREDGPVHGSPLVDGVKADSVGGSPTSSVGGQPRPQKKQLPISRTAGTGYERPERARTSHACEPCRERKTKCDGERPSCRRCLHTGTSCHYGYGKGWKKRKTVEDLNVTSRRLARYEQLLDEIYPLVSENVRDLITQARQQDFAVATAAESADSSTSASVNAIDGDAKTNSPSFGRLPLPPLPMPLPQSTPPFTTAVRPLPPPMPVDGTYSSSHSSSTIPTQSKSPVAEDASGASALRLPSITRHGFLVDSGSKSQSPAQTVPEREPQPLPDQDSKMLLDDPIPSASIPRAPSG